MCVLQEAESPFMDGEFDHGEKKGQKMKLTLLIKS